MSDAGKVESELRGTTLRVYWHLFKSPRSVGVRELQRAMGFASPSTALHHLEKLRELGLVGKDNMGQYLLTQEVKVGTLRHFLRFGRLVLPRYLFYAVFFSSTLIVYVLQAIMLGLQSDPLIVIIGGSASAVSWYETARLWREKLF